MNTPLNLSLQKNINVKDLIKNLKYLNTEIKILRKENEALKEKINNNVVLFVPGEHSQWDKTCPYCNSKDIEKKIHVIVKPGSLEPVGHIGNGIFIIIVNLVKKDFLPLIMVIGKINIKNFVIKCFDELILIK